MPVVQREPLGERRARRLDSNGRRRRGCRRPDSLRRRTSRPAPRSPCRRPAVRGSASRNSTVLGFLYEAMLCRQCSISSAARDARHPPFSTTTALTSCSESLARAPRSPRPRAPRHGLPGSSPPRRGRCSLPPDLIILVIVPRKVIVPSASRRPRSVVCHQPPRKRSLVDLRAVPVPRCTDRPRTQISPASPMAHSCVRRGRGSGREVTGRGSAGVAGCPGRRTRRTGISRSPRSGRSPSPGRRPRGRSGSSSARDQALPQRGGDGGLAAPTVRARAPG